MSVAKEGKVVEQKKSLQTLLDTHEGQKMTWTSLILTSLTPAVYSIAQFWSPGKDICPQTKSDFAQ